MASLIVASSLGLYSSIKYLPKDQGPCISIRFTSASSSNKISIVLFPRSRISKEPPTLHMLHKVQFMAPMFVFLLVKNFAANFFELSVSSSARPTAWLSFALRESFAHRPRRSSMIQLECWNQSFTRREKNGLSLDRHVSFHLLLLLLLLNLKE